ncbi:acyl-CoA thioesterase [Marinibaculum pumilum]|uniref:Acyl-CoA thioesterase n=1 Tax=Marinibaculum pumilum TaxID=1766165 RepID=A0ABV7L4M3_9PROT
MARAEFNFCFPFRVRYSEIDGQKVVFNAHYLTYFDTAITEYFRELGYDYMAQVERTGTDFHTVRTLVDYKRPILFDDEIEVHVRTARIGRSSIGFAVEIHPQGKDDLYASGEVVWVNTDQTSHKSAPVPEELVPLLEGFEKKGLRG